MINKQTSPELWDLLFLGRDTDKMLAMGQSNNPLDTIYTKGEPESFHYALSRPRIAVIGTRDSNPYGSHCTNTIIEALSRNQLKPVIVSGLAMGTDTRAHNCALLNGLLTIAVLPTGLDEIYPLQNRELAQNIIKGRGALITPFPKKTSPEPINFFKRNYVLAAMSDLIIIPETKIKGSVTVVGRFASMYDIPVMAVPGRIDDMRSQGCNRLIAEGVALPLVDIEKLSDSSYLQKLIGRKFDQKNNP